MVRKIMPPYFRVIVSQFTAELFIALDRTINVVKFMTSGLWIWLPLDGAKRKGLCSIRLRAMILGPIECKYWIVCFLIKIIDAKI